MDRVTPISFDESTVTCHGDTVDRTPLIRRGLEEARMMLNEMPAEPGAAELLEQLQRIDARVRDWSSRAPNAVERAAMLNDVLTLKLDVSRLRHLPRTSGILSRAALGVEIEPASKLR
jgi:hypothetical protein